MARKLIPVSGFSDVLIGLQYGDEGKAKVIDLFGHRYDVIARFNGGANAGHTIETSRGRLGLRQLPSGVLTESCHLYIGSGCAANLPMLVAELDAVQRLGIDLTGRLTINARAAVIQPHHIDFDRRHGALIGTTGNGIGPCYADRALRAIDGRRVSLCVGDFVSNLDDALKKVVENATAAGYEGARSLAEELQDICDAALILAPYVSFDDLFLFDWVTRGAKVLFEGAQSSNSMLSKMRPPM